MVKAAVKEQRKEHTKNSLRSISHGTCAVAVFVVVLLKDKEKKEGCGEGFVSCGSLMNMICGHVDSNTS